MGHLLLLWLSTSISLVIVSKLGLGLEVDKFASAAIAAIAIGAVNSLVKPILVFLTLPVTIVTLGLFLFVVNGISLMLVSAIVTGFRTKGLFGAVVGSIALSLINLVVSRLIGAVL